jgi:hypothetical protein
MTMDTFLKCDYKTKQTFVNCADIAILGQSGKSTASLKPINKTTVAPIPSKITTRITSRITTSIASKTNPINNILPLWSQCGGLV